MRLEHVAVFGVLAVVTYVASIYLWPRLLLLAFKRAILVKGFGGGPVPINTLYTEPEALFADPIHPPASASGLATRGVNHDTLLTVGWLDLSGGAQVLHVPKMGDRYYSVQLTDPTTNAPFAYVGTRTTGADAGDFLITGPSWRGERGSGMPRLSSPHDAVLVVGRVLVRDDVDLPAAHALTEQIRIAPSVR